VLPIDDDGHLELVELDGVAADPLAGEALDVLGVGYVGRRRGVVLGVDDDAAVRHVGHVDAVVQRVGSQFAKTGKRTQRVVGHPPAGGRRTLYQPVDDASVFRVEAPTHALDCAFAGAGPFDVRAVEVRLDRL